MFAFLCLHLLVGATELEWHNDYATAVRQARRDNKDLLVHFQGGNQLEAVLSDPSLKKSLSECVLLQVPAAYEFAGKQLLQHDSLVEMQGRPGLAIISYRDPKLATHEHVISVHPLARSRYGWAPDYGVREVRTILDLPAWATLSQRSMIYAICVHPERPQSVYCEAHPAFLGHAERHSARQASMQNQHHADLIGSLARLSSESGRHAGNGSEVVAESWGRFVGGENVLEAAFSCVDAWRHSPGHWSAVSGRHRCFGYDVARGPNGTWYATGIFAD